MSIILSAPSPPSGKLYVLVHGAFFGGWCWKFVAHVLRARGHLVHTPTLSGLGVRSHSGTNTTLEGCIDDVAHVIIENGLDNVALVGHSFAGSIVSAIADRMPTRIRHLIYLDGQLLLSGQSAADKAPAASMEIYQRRAIQTEQGQVIPPATARAFGVTDPALARLGPV